MAVIKKLTIGGVTYDTVGEASVSQVVSTGTKIATVTIDGTSTDLYAPSGGSSVDPATATPIMDGTAAVGSSTKYAREDHVHPTDTSRQATLVSGTNIKTVNSTSLLGSGDIAVQPTLVSGTNIKTVNGNSLLGSGDITISGGSSPSTATAILTVAGWSSNTQTVTVTGMTSNATVIVASAPTSISDYSSAGVYCSAQGTDSLTFTCSSTPSSALTANVMWFEGGAVSDYNITVQLTNPANPGYFSSCEIWSVASNSFYDRIEQIGTISSATGSANITVDSDVWGFQVEFSGASPSTSGASASCTGGVSYIGEEYGVMLFEVTGDGVATISGVNYDD